MPSRRARPTRAAENKRTRARSQRRSGRSPSPAPSGPAAPSKSPEESQGWPSAAAGRRSAESTTLGVLDEEAGFYPRLGQFLDEQRVTIGLGADLFHHFGRQRAPPGHPRDHVFNVVAMEATERQGADVGETSPGR